uniref:protein-tyrosine-phosphatase n=1 Tax=Strigamia maritima TaxID=126957 RepID=T1IID6_STRMM
MMPLPSPVSRVRSSCGRIITVSDMTVDKLGRCLALGDADDAASLATVLVIDCRPFMSYNQAHVDNAVNVFCPTIMRRRIRDHPSLASILRSTSSCDKLRRGRYLNCVIYNEGVEGPSKDVQIRLVLCCLRKETNIKNFYYLTGGFDKFYSRYPHLCVGRMTASSPMFPVVAAPIALFSDHSEPVEILPHLYLGSECQASNPNVLTRLGITALVNVSLSVSFSHLPTLIHKCIPVEDTCNEEIGRWFREAIEFIDDVKNAGGKALIHCPAGVSRSATICLAYVMQSQQLRLDDAFEFVRSRRHVISPNFNFMGQLLKFESQVFPTTRNFNSNSPELKG